MGVFHQLALSSDLQLRAREKEMAAQIRLMAWLRQRTHKKTALKHETKFHLLKPLGEENTFQGASASTIWGWAEMRGSSPQLFQDGSEERGGPRRPQVVHPLLPPRTLLAEVPSVSHQPNWEIRRLTVSQSRSRAETPRRAPRPAQPEVRHNPARGQLCAAAAAPLGIRRSSCHLCLGCVGD